MATCPGLRQGQAVTIHPNLSGLGTCFLSLGEFQKTPDKVGKPIPSSHKGSQNDHSLPLSLVQRHPQEEVGYDGYSQFPPTGLVRARSLRAQVCVQCTDQPHGPHSSPLTCLAWYILQLEQ